MYFFNLETNKWSNVSLSSPSGASSQLPSLNPAPVNTALIIGTVVAAVIILALVFVIISKSRRTKRHQKLNQHSLSNFDMHTSLVSILDRIRRITTKKSPDMSLAESIALARTQNREVTPIKITGRDSLFRRFTRRVSTGNKISPKYERMQANLLETGRTLYKGLSATIASSGLAPIQGQFFTAKTGITLEGEKELMFDADVIYLSHVLNGALLSETNRLFHVEMLPEYLIEAKKFGFISDQTTEMTEDAAWKKITEIYCTDQHVNCALMSKSVNDMAFRVIEAVEHSLAEIFPPNFPFEFDVPQFRKIVLDFICFYTACKGLNPLFEFYMPANGSLFDGNRMVANDLARGEENANVLFADKFGMCAGENIVVKASVMSM